MIGAPLTCDEVHDLAPGYVLDVLGPEEAAAVRRHLATCTRGHPEIAELGGAASALAISVDPVEPAPALRARVLAQLESEATRSPAPSRAHRLAGRRPALGRWRWAAYGIAVVLIAALVGTSGLLARRLADAQAYASAASLAASIAAEQGSRAIALVPATADGLKGTAVVAADGRGVVLLDGTPSLSGSQVLEVWLIAGTTGSPVPAGAASLVGDGRAWVPLSGATASGGLTVAVTREPAPGATKPTLPILSSGSSG